MMSARPTLWTAADVAAATRGRSTGDWVASGVSIDSRSVEAGDLFIAISGPNHDGHAYVADALANGAAGAVVAKTMDGIDPARLIVVADTMAALEDLARAARDRCAGGIVGVTGSVGKTGTKEMLSRALGAQTGGADAVSATAGNLNNHWGLPLSLARMPSDADFGALEMGMNHPGEISPLSRMARPHVAVITTVADTHSEYFDGLEQIADAKAEIFDGLTEGGTAVLNADIAMFPRLAEAARRAGVAKIVTFGAGEGADCRLLKYSTQGAQGIVSTLINGQTLDFTLGQPGRHLALNALAVLAAVDALGADVEKAAESLAEMKGLKGRGERHQIALADGTFEMIDEAYNASPASMAAAIAVLTGSQPQSGGRRIAVLGDMLELGAKADALHAALVAPLAEGGIDKVYCAGTHMAALWRALPADMRGHHAETSEDLLDAAVNAVRAGDVVMVKGSLGSRMQPIVDALLQLGPASVDAMPRVVNGG